MNQHQNKKIYLNHAGVGLISKENHSAMRRFLDDYLRVGPPEVIEKYQEYIPLLSQEIATLLNCSPDETIYIKNTTEGISIATEVLPLKKGDEVLLLSNEYGANKVPWLKKMKEGMAVTIVKGDGSAEAYKNLLKAISPRTKAIAISLVQYYDGYRLDLKKLSALCKKKGIFLVVDAIQEAGTRVIDLKKTPVDILIAGGQKHLGAIQGSGFLYVNKRIMPILKDTRAGVRSMKKFSDEGYILRDTAKRFEDGTANLVSVVSLYYALKRINTIGIKTIEKKNLLLLRQLKLLLRVNGIPFIDHQVQGNLVSLTVPDPKGLYAFLRRNHIYTKLIGGIVRVSFLYTSAPRDFAILVKKTLQFSGKYGKSMHR